MPGDDGVIRIDAGPQPGLRLSRRQALQRGALWGGSCAAWTSLLGRWAAADAAGPPKAGARAKSVILIFNPGAPSHLDLWDPKPEADSAVRGEFSTIATRTPGVFVSELIPELAARSERLAILRSVSHHHGGHNSGMYWSIVGRPYKRDDTQIHPSRTDIPCVGALTGWLAQRDGYSGPLPPYVITPKPTHDAPSSRQANRAVAWVRISIPSC